MPFCTVAALFHIWSTSFLIQPLFDIKMQGKQVLCSGEKVLLDFFVELSIVSSSDVRGRGKEAD